MGNKIQKGRFHTKQLRAQIKVGLSSTWNIVSPKRNVLITTLFLFSLIFPCYLKAQTLHLSIAASMTDAFKTIISEFASTHPKQAIRSNFASSGSLAKQIYQGAPADIYVSANPKWMKYLVQKEMIEVGTDLIFAYNSLVFVGHAKGDTQSLAELVKLDRIAIGTPSSVPAGQYAKQALVQSNLYTNLAEKKKLIFAKDVRQALIYADQGEVDGAFVYKTDALLARKAVILFEVPTDLYDRVSYPIALTNQGANNQLAKEFYDFMFTEKARAVLKSYGFIPN